MRCRVEAHADPGPGHDGSRRNGCPVLAASPRLPRPTDAQPRTPGPTSNPPHPAALGTAMPPPPRPRAHAAVAVARTHSPRALCPAGPARARRCHRLHWLDQGVGVVRGLEAGLRMARRHLQHGGPGRGPLAQVERPQRLDPVSENPKTPSAPPATRPNPTARSAPPVPPSATQGCTVTGFGLHSLSARPSSGGRPSKSQARGGMISTTVATVDLVQGPLHRSSKEWGVGRGHSTACSRPLLQLTHASVSPFRRAGDPIGRAPPSPIPLPPFPFPLLPYRFPVPASRFPLPASRFPLPP